MGNEGDCNDTSGDWVGWEGKWMGGLYRRLVEVEKEGDGKETLGDWARWEGNGMGRLYQEIGWDWKGR